MYVGFWMNEDYVLLSTPGKKKKNHNFNQFGKLQKVSTFKKKIIKEDIVIK